MQLAEDDAGSASRDTEAGSQTYDARLGPLTISTALSPAIFPEQASYSDRTYSPAPAVASSVDMPVSVPLSRRGTSEYNTDNEETEEEPRASFPEQDVDMNVDVSYPGMSAPPASHIYRQRVPDTSAFEDQDMT